MYQLYSGPRDRHALFIRSVQLPSRKGKQRTHALASTQYGVTHRVVQTLGSNICGGKQGLQGIFYAYLAAPRPILEISGHRYRTGRNFSVYRPQEDVSVVAHPVALIGSIVTTLLHVCEPRAIARAAFALLPFLLQCFPVRPMQLQNSPAGKI